MRPQLQAGTSASRSASLGTRACRHGHADIIAGVRTFQRDVYPQYRELFEKLSAGQSPEALVITCSDSRVDPFLFTNAQPGQLFVLRNAGNLVPKYDGIVGGVTATIEFAVVGLRVPNIIVCGHSGCGAIHGLLHPETLENMPHVADWLQPSRRAGARDSGQRRPARTAPTRCRRRSTPTCSCSSKTCGPIRAWPNALAAGRITLHGWVYDIASGEIRAYDERVAAVRGAVSC